MNRNPVSNFISKMNLFTYKTSTVNKKTTDLTAFTQLIDSIYNKNIDINSICGTKEGAQLQGKEKIATISHDKKERAQLQETSIIYVPFPVTEDTFEIIFTLNVPRVAAGKKPLNVLSHSPKAVIEEARKKFEKSRYPESDLNPGRKLYQQYKSKNVFTKDRRKELEKITDYIESAPEALTINPAKPTDNEVNEQTPEKLSKTLKKKKVYVNFLEKIQAAAEAGALDQTEFISIDEIDETSQLSKVYVLAHGIAGDQNIYAKDATQKKSAAEVVSEIKALIKTDQTVDIRLTFCQSADDRTITSFEKTELDEARKNSCGNISLAKHVSNECKTQKVNAKVHGYHGNGVYEYSRFYHKTRKPVGDNKLRIRASKARAEFIPN